MFISYILYAGRSSEIQSDQPHESTPPEAYQPSEAFSSDDETRENLIQELQNELGGNYYSINKLGNLIRLQEFLLKPLL